MKFILQILLILLTFLSTLSVARSHPKLAKSAYDRPSIHIGNTIIGFGSIENYVSNSIWFDEENHTWRTFLIGRADLQYPSMMREDGNYENNHYLYNGAFFVGYNNTCIRFDTRTSDDFFVAEWDTAYPAPMYVSYSMTDDSADAGLRVGIKTICKIYCWPEPDRSEYFIYEYIVINKSENRLNDVYCALFMDCDVSAAEGGTSGNLAFFRDDLVNYVIGTDMNGNPESISYMYDGDNPDIAGDDTGGRRIPKESTGYIGSRVLKSPATKHGVPANQQSGHEYWHLSDPIISTFYWHMTKESFEDPPDWPHDFRYLQTLGPWDLQSNDSLQVVFALSIGEGWEGLRANLQTAYDQYRSGHQGKAVPYILSYSPTEDTVIAHQGEIIRFEVSAFDKNGEDLLYTWEIDSMLSIIREPSHTFESGQYETGRHTMLVDVANTRYHHRRKWVIDLQPAKKYALLQNYPNPFNNETVILFELKTSGRTTLDIYDLLGRRVKHVLDKYLSDGSHQVSWDGRDQAGNDVAGGIYFYYLRSGDYKAARKLVYLK